MLVITIWCSFVCIFLFRYLIEFIIHFLVLADCCNVITSLLLQSRDICVRLATVPQVSVDTAVRQSRTIRASTQQSDNLESAAFKIICNRTLRDFIFGQIQSNLIRTLMYVSDVRRHIYSEKYSENNTKCSISFYALLSI